MVEPHGGRLVDRVVVDDHEAQIRDELASSPTLKLDIGQYQDVINIANGRYSPVEGFLTRNDFLKVVHDMTLEDGTTWPLPLVLDVDAQTSETLTPGNKAGLRGPTGELIGAIAVKEIYKYNAEEATRGIFGTDDPDHPGVAALLDYEDFFVGGPVYVFERERYNDADLLPKETRVLFERNDWQTVVGFQTRNAPHRAHEYIQKSALEHVDGLLVQPKIGDKKSGDYRNDVILGAYRTLLEQYYQDDRVALTVFPSRMHYAGPREAVFDALVRKNQGCSHFVVGRDHAGVEDYYDSYDAQRIFKELGDVGIEPLFYNYSFYCDRCDGMASETICPHEDTNRVYPSGTEIRRQIDAGQSPSKKLMRPEVASYVMNTDMPFVTEQEAKRGET
jgi:sulfate adenylyltransferase